MMCTFVIVFMKLLEISSETTSYKICNQYFNNNNIYDEGEMFKMLSLQHFRKNSVSAAPIQHSPSP